jgi:hypothetical protein
MSLEIISRWALAPVPTNRRKRDAANFCFPDVFVPTCFIR